MINGALLTQEFKTAFASWNGEQFDPFCLALGSGIALSLSGQLQFTTVDIGLTPGAGAGTGTGIDLPPSSISQLTFAKGQAIWAPFQRDGPGLEWKGFCDKMAAAVAAHLKKNAQLMSVDAPVFLGNGQVIKYFGVSIQQMTSLIVLQGPPTWAEARFPELAEAVSTGIITALITDDPKESVSIVGGGALPVPGAGVGNGTVL